MVRVHLKVDSVLRVEFGLRVNLRGFLNSMLKMWYNNNTAECRVRVRVRVRLQL